MTNVKNLDDVMIKVEELRSSLRFSDEILPMISDMFLFIKDIIPIMLEANAFMKDGTNEIPVASENLNNISKTTEIATHEVLDKLDSIMERLDRLSDELTEQKVKTDTLDSVNEIKNTASEIIYAFQFQDITSQQLEHVNRILQAIYEKFITLFQSFMKIRRHSNLGGDVITAIENELKQIKDLESREYFSKRTMDHVHQNSTSQDAIDSFFKQIMDDNSAETPIRE